MVLDVELPTSIVSQVHRQVVKESLSLIPFTLLPRSTWANSLGYWVDSENRRCNFTGSDADTGANSLFSLWDEAVTTRQAVAIANDMWKTTDWMDEDAEVDPKGEDFC